MIELDNLKIELQNYKQNLVEIKGSLDIDNKNKKIIEYDRLMQEQDFWADVDKANKISKEASNIKKDIDDYKQLENSFNDINDMIDIANADNDASLVQEIFSMYDDFIKTVSQVKTRLLFAGEYDNLDAIVRLNAGSGGTESCDFCSMLYRMYNRYAQKKGFAFEILDYLDGDEAGIKSVTFELKGQYAYGYMKSEMGVHRLVRISPFNAQGKRQTSFASCDVMPDIKEDLNVEIRDEDIKMDVYRSSGAGGQHINKTSSAVRLTHIPTGIVVACQQERNQIQNKDKAMQMLKAKLFILKQQENETKLSGIRGTVMDNAFGSQIRSYVLQPYRMVKDLRTGEETGNSDAVLDGDIEKFSISYLQWLKLGCPDRKVKEAQDE